MPAEPVQCKTDDRPRYTTVENPEVRHYKSDELPMETEEPDSDELTPVEPGGKHGKTEIPAGEEPKATEKRTEGPVKPTKKTEEMTPREPEGRHDETEMLGTIELEATAGHNRPVEATCDRPQVYDAGQGNTGEPTSQKPEVNPDETDEPDPEETEVKTEETPSERPTSRQDEAEEPPTEPEGPASKEPEEPPDAGKQVPDDHNQITV